MNQSPEVTHRETIPAAVLASAQAHPDDPALLAWSKGGWHGLTYAELAGAVVSTATGLARLGIGPGDRVALLGPNSPAWGTAYLAILHLGAVAVPLDRLQTPGEWSEALKVSEARAVITAAREAETLKPQTAEIQSLEHFIWLEEPAAVPDLSVNQIASLGTEGAPPPGTGNADDLAVLIFTSGTTGKSKGVMLSHRNILFDARAMLARIDLRGARECFLSVLPLSHCYESTCGLVAPLLAGARVCYARGMTATEIVADLRSSGATLLLGVPLLYEKLVAGIERGLNKQATLKGRVGRRLWRFTRSGSPRLRRPLGRALLGSVRKRAGLGMIRYLVSGGAPLPPDAGIGLAALGVNFLQGYGLTETAPVATLNPVRANDPLSVGHPLPGVEVKILDPDRDGQGEILIRGPIVTRGYWREPEETARVMSEGWFKTGDLGRFAPNGHLYITGRSKHLIVTPGGKNISPEEVELAAARSPFIAEMIVYGAPAKGGAGEDVHALIYPDHEYYADWSKASGQTTDLREILRAEIDRATEHLARYKRIAGFEIAAEPFVKTTSQKIKRHVHTEKLRHDGAQ